jgi:hypothetical protein
MSSGNSGRTVSERYWCILIGGLDNLGKLANYVYSDYYHYYEMYVQNAASVADYDDIQRVTERYSQEQRGGFLAYGRGVLQASNERHFTVTENGRLGADIEYECRISGIAYSRGLQKSDCWR